MRFSAPSPLSVTSTLLLFLCGANIAMDAIFVQETKRVAGLRDPPISGYCESAF